MCVLCGQDFVAQAHWTDRYVEDRAREAGPDADLTVYQRGRRRHRAHGEPMTAEVLAYYVLWV